MILKIAVKGINFMESILFFWDLHSIKCNITKLKEFGNHKFLRHPVLTHEVTFCFRF